MNRVILLGVGALIIVVISMIVFMPLQDDPAEGGAAPGTPPMSADAPETVD